MVGMGNLFPFEVTLALTEDLLPLPASQPHRVQHGRKSRRL
jgi:hypothetical protein